MRSKKLLALLVGSALLGGATAWFFPGAVWSRKGAMASGGEAASSSVRQGRWVQIGEDRARALREALTAHPALQSSSEGLVEVRAPGGGVMVDLGGRFRSAALAVTEARERLAVGCRQPGAQLE